MCTAVQLVTARLQVKAAIRLQEGRESFEANVSVNRLTTRVATEMPHLERKQLVR